MPAVADQTTQKQKFLTWLKEQDEAVFYVHDGPVRSTFKGKEKDLANVATKCLPKEFADVVLLGSCWGSGDIEFGRANHSFGYHGDHIGAIKRDAEGKPLTFAWLDFDYSWTGPRTPQRKGPQELFAEPIPVEKVIKQSKRWNENRKEYEIVREEYPGALLRLQVRLTNKGWGNTAETGV